VKWRFLTALGAVLAAAPLAAQVELYYRGSGSELPVKGRLDAGSLAAGDFTDIPLRLRNQGEETIALRQLRVAGAGFTLENHPPLPHTMASGANVDFRIRFAPKDPGSYSATFIYHDQSIFITGRSPELASVFYQRNGEFFAWRNSFTVDFGRVERKQSIARQFMMSNATTAAREIRSATTSAAEYSVQGLALPVTLAPSESVSFEIRFSPTRSGVVRGNLVVDGRSLPMEAFAVEPPFPEARLLFPESIASGQQIPIQILFTAPSKAIGVGTLTIDGLDSDPAVMFLASGSREAAISIREGDTELSQVLQTGTTAGDLTVRLALDGHTYEAVARIPASSVSVEDAVGVRTTNGIQIRLDGFDNTRSASRIAFTFYDGAGNMLGGAPVSADVAGLFAQYFESSPIGGLFALRALFPVTGDPAGIGAVEVEIVNSAGSSKTSKINF
jgi:hypothetical protein